MIKHTKLTKPERVLISEWIKQGLCGNEIANRLGRDRSTVGRELKRNKTKVRVGKYDEEIYEPNHAQFVADQRKQKAFNAKQPLKSKKIYGYVMEHLRGGWSPEGIAGRLRKEDHPDDPSWWICHETIYAFIYKEKTDLTSRGLITQSLLDKRLERHNQAITVTDFDQPLYEYLRRKQTKRRKKSSRKVHRSHIPDRVSIHQRPESINQRIEFGHWEGDTVEGRGHKNGVHTEVERVSRLIKGRKVKAIDSQSALDAQQKIFAPLPEKARRSTTLDNGKETHLLMKDLTKLDFEKTFTVFITHPSLKNGCYLGRNKISWGHSEDWPNYTTVYLWHEILHSYFSTSVVDHAIISFLTDEELRMRLNGDKYPPFTTHEELHVLMEEMLPEWQKYLTQEEKNIEMFTKTLVKKYGSRTS